MAVVEKKIWPESFQRILNGEKKFELRLADFDIKEGDIFLLREWNPETKEYTGRKIEKKVTFVDIANEMKYWKKEDIDKFGFQIISFD